MPDDPSQQTGGWTRIQPPTLSQTTGRPTTAGEQQSGTGMLPSGRGAGVPSPMGRWMQEKIGLFHLPEATARSMTSSLLSRIAHETTASVVGHDGQFEYAKPGPFWIKPGASRSDLSHCLAELDRACGKAPEDAVASLVAVLRARTASANKDPAEARFEAEVMIADLARYPLDIVEYACDYWVNGGATSKWFPSWPELKEICERRVEGRRRLQRALVHALSEAQK